MKLEELPYDLDELIEEDEHILGTYSEKFDKVMIDNGLFEYGTVRRSHRIITNKCRELGYYGVIEILTGLSKEEVKQYFFEQSKKERIQEMKKTAEEFGYILTKKNIL